MTPLTTSFRPLALTLASGLLPVVLLLGGCGDSSESSTDTTEQSTDPAAHNEADVAFATQMIPHHAQALTMADLAVGRDVSPQLTDLLDEIRAAQTPEIELMVDWLQQWGEPVPATMRDHAHADDHGGDGDGGEEDMSGDMPGMMDDSDLDELADAPPAKFEDLWLTMMIEHHQGAVDMAETQLEEGSFEPALELAEDIKTSQSAEIERMQEMLAD